MADWHVKTGQVAEARELVLKYHYSRRFPSVVQHVVSHHAPGGLFGDSGPMLAALVWSSPPTRWSSPVYELSRLVCTPEARGHPLTALISDGCRVVKDEGSVHLVVSFADWSHQHHGGVYQAASWNFHGKRQAGQDGVMVGGVFVPGRTSNARYGTRSVDKLREQGIDAEPHYDDGKYLYWKPLNNKGKRQAEELGLECNPYPKPLD